MSDNITVRSIVGRYLEHSRIFSFANDGDEQIYIGSADMMHRNLDRRVEVLVQLTNEPHIAQIEELFRLAFDDRTASWWLGPDGWAKKTTDAEGRPLLDMQAHLISVMSQRRGQV